MNDLTDILHRGHHSLVVSNGRVETFDRPGVIDLYELLIDEPAFLEGAEVADKVVGKGAAALMILGKIRALQANVISEPALNLLSQSAIQVSYKSLVHNIINRAGDGICPVETLCLPCATAHECLPVIARFLKNMK